VLSLFSEGMDLGAQLQAFPIQAEAQVLPAAAYGAHDEAVVLLHEEPEGIEGRIRGLVLCGWGRLQGGLIAEAGQKQLGKDQDASSLGQCPACQMQCSIEVLLRLAGNNALLEAGGSHDKIKAAPDILR